MTAHCTWGLARGLALTAKPFTLPVHNTHYRFLSAYYGPGILISPLWCILSNPPKWLHKAGAVSVSFHCTDEETETQRIEDTCPKSHSWEGTGRVIVATSVWLFQPYLMTIQIKSQTCLQSSSHRGHLATNLSAVLSRTPCQTDMLQGHPASSCPLVLRWLGLTQAEAKERPCTDPSWLLVPLPLYRPRWLSIADATPTLIGLNVPSQGPLTTHPRGKCL